MKTETVTITKSEYTRLLDENNSLRKLVNQFVDGVKKLGPAKKGGRFPAPSKLEADKVSKMTPKQAKEYYSKKLTEKYQ